MACRAIIRYQLSRNGFIGAILAGVPCVSSMSHELCHATQVSTDQHAATIFRSGVPARHLVATPLVTLPPPRARDLPPWEARPTALFFGGQTHGAGVSYMPRRKLAKYSRFNMTSVVYTTRCREATHLLATCLHPLNPATAPSSPLPPRACPYSRPKPGSKSRYRPLFNTPHSRWVFEKALEKAGSPCKGTACKSVGLKALQGGCKGRPTDTCSPLYMRPCQDGAMRGGCVASVEQVRASLPSTYSRTMN